jgi:L-fuconate dehydratase
MTPPHMGALHLWRHFHSSSLPSFVPPGYSDEKIARLTKEAVQAGFNHFKMKVGTDLADDLRRGKLIRSIIDDPQYLPPDDPEFSSASSSARRVTSADDPALAGKNAGPAGAVLMIDANQVWDVQQAIDYVSSLAEIKPWCVLHKSLYPRRRGWGWGFWGMKNWLVVCARAHALGSRFIEEPTAPDDILGHATIRRALKPHRIGVATGEHAHNRMVFKQLFQADAIDVCQIDSCRLAGVSEVLSVLFMATKWATAPF